MTEQWRIFWAITGGSLFMALGAGVAAYVFGVSQAHSATFGVAVFVACLGAGIWRQGA